MNKTINIFWFRQDLRLLDNPALFNATLKGKVILIYILDDLYNEGHHLGGASRVWLHESLKNLNEQCSNKIIFYSGDSLKIINKIIQEFKPNSFYWNRLYDKWSIDRDKKAKKIIEEQGIEVKTYNSSLVIEPWNVLKEDCTPYKVFTPFYKKAYLSSQLLLKTYDKPRLSSILNYSNKEFTLDNLELLPKLKWVDNVLSKWKIGETEALNKLKLFLSKKADNYKEGRNFPSSNSVSYLSPHIHFGEISVKYIWKAVSRIKMNKDLTHFLSELGWREFSYYLLYHFPNLPNNNLQEKFNDFPWVNNQKLLYAWKKGETGYPIVDAGMRELYQTGYMNNRVRMIVSSFLVKNLLIHWHEGRKWFWECLFDADLANNSASWQWVAGCGADAAPYFRVFNPILQAKKFDPYGVYIKKYVPELSKLENKYLFSPWETPKDILVSSNVELGVNYPFPVVDLIDSRNKALLAYKKIK